MAQTDVVYLRHILDAIARIQEYLDGVSEDEFYQKHLVQDGVIRQLEIIGEAAKQVSRETRESVSTIPWKDMAGMRDKLIHDYFGVDLEQVWLTATGDIPEIEKVIAQALTFLQ